MSKTAFLFPGQGAQYVGMGHQLYETLPAAQALFEQAREILGYDLAQICFHGPAERLNATDVSQPAIFVASLAALESLKQSQPELIQDCGAAAGLSLGEYTALVFAGVIDFPTALQVVQQRGKAMQAASEAVASGMVSVLGMDAEPLEKLCHEVRQPGEVLQIANFLCPKNIVVSGSAEACLRIGPAAESAGAMKTISLAVAGAFHTPLMQPAVEPLEAVLAPAPLLSPRIPVVSNVDARPHSDPEEIRRLLTQQVVQPVRWEDSIRYLVDQGYDAFYEIGPGKVLRGLLRRIDRKLSCENVEG